MKVSLIVNAYNNNVSLFFLLISILRQTLSDIEVIIINNSNKNNRLLTMFINKAKFHVIVINDKLPISNLWNKAINMASGDYIMFLDNNDYLNNKALELIYNSKSDEDILVTNGYKRFLIFRYKSDFSFTKSDNNLYHEILANNKLIKRSVLLDNPFMNDIEIPNLSNMPIILSNYKVRVLSYRVITSKVNNRLIFKYQDNLLDVINMLDYIKPKLQIRDYKIIAIIETLYRLENYFYSNNNNELVLSKLKDKLYETDNYWFDYEIVKIIMKKDILYRYFINHANL